MLPSLTADFVPLNLFYFVDQECHAFVVFCVDVATGTLVVSDYL